MTLEIYYLDENQIKRRTAPFDANKLAENLRRLNHHKHLSIRKVKENPSALSRTIDTRYILESDLGA